ncbi:hypothetical protein ABZP36_035148 [Zizania latifolia]
MRFLYGGAVFEGMGLGSGVEWKGWDGKKAELMRSAGESSTRAVCVTPVRAACMPCHANGSCPAPAACLCPQEQRGMATVYAMPPLLC